MRGRRHWTDAWEQRLWRQRKYWIIGPLYVRSDNERCTKLVQPDIQIAGFLIVSLDVDEALLQGLGFVRCLHFVLQVFPRAGANRLDCGDENLAGLLREQIGLEITPDTKRYRGSAG